MALCGSADGARRSCSEKKKRYQNTRWRKKTSRTFACVMHQSTVFAPPSAGEPVSATHEPLWAGQDTRPGHPTRVSLTPDDRAKSIALQCFLWPTAGQSAHVSLDPDARAPLSIEFFSIYVHMNLNSASLREIWFLCEPNTSSHLVRSFTIMLSSDSEFPYFVYVLQKLLSGRIEKV